RRQWWRHELGRGTADQRGEQQDTYEAWNGHHGPPSVRNASSVRVRGLAAERVGFAASRRRSSGHRGLTSSGAGPLVLFRVPGLWPRAGILLTEAPDWQGKTGDRWPGTCSCAWCRAGAALRGGSTMGGAGLARGRADVGEAEAVAQRPLAHLDR